MVFGIDPRSRLKSELALSEMRLVLVASRSAIIFLADKATIIGSVPYMDATLFYYVNF